MEFLNRQNHYKSESILRFAVSQSENTATTLPARSSLYSTQNPLCRLQTRMSGRPVGE